MTDQPNLYFIGGMRCGSTTLNAMLGQHPDIFMSPVKEPGYWTAELARRRGRTADPALRGNHTTAEAYAKLFADAGCARWRGECSHYFYRGGTAPLIAEAVPAARIIVSLRDPTARLYSEFLYYRRIAASGGRGFSGSFEAFVAERASIGPTGRIEEVERGSRLLKGLQAEKLAPWLEHFSREQVMLVRFERLTRETDTVTREIFRWLGLDDTVALEAQHLERGGIPRNAGLARLMNRGGPAKSLLRAAFPQRLRRRIRTAFYSRTLEQPEMPPSLEAGLRAYYTEDVSRLEQIIGESLESWKSGKTGPVA